MDLILDFGSQLPEHLTPAYNKVVSLLTQTVPEFPRGAAMLTKEKKGIFAIKIWDKSRAEKLLNKKVEYYYEEGKSNKCITVQIQERAKSMRFVNPKYVTMTGFNFFPASEVANDQLDKILGNFGEILVPTQDVFAEVFLTGKKKARIDLTKGKEIPRELFIEFVTPTGKKHSTSVRCFYKGQPYHCKRCRDNYTGDCPEWLEEKDQKEKVKKWKDQNTRTTMIGDSNLRCVNEGGVMTSVTAITGGKIGHIANQLQFENLSAIDNVILSSGQNCISDLEKLGKGPWEKRTLGEITELENQVKSLINVKKNVFILNVPPVPLVTRTKELKEARSFINTNLQRLCERSAKKHPNKITFVAENDGNYNASIDFTDERHLAPIAVERLLNNMDQHLPTNQKLKNENLTGHATGKPYRGCYGTYPVGCNFCTRLKHGEPNCPLLTPTEKRPLSTGGDDNQPKQLKMDKGNKN